MRKFKFDGIAERTSIEILRLGSSTILIFGIAHFSTPNQYIYLLSVISFASISSAYFSLGLPFWVQLATKDSDHFILQKLIVFATLLCLLTDFFIAGKVLKADSPKVLYLLLIAEVIVNIPIFIKGRIFLSSGRNREYAFQTLIFSILRTSIILVSVLNSRISSYIYFAYLFLVLAYFTISYSPAIMKIYVIEKRSLIYIKKSSLVGVSSILVSSIDALPILFAVHILSPVNAGIFALVMRISSVANIPGNSLASVTITDIMKSGKNDHKQKHFLVSSLMALLTILLIHLILSHSDLLSQYPGVANYLWIGFLLSLLRNFNITWGNSLTIFGRVGLRLTATLLSFILLVILLSLCALGTLEKSIQGFFTYSIIAESVLGISIFNANSKLPTSD